MINLKKGSALMIALFIIVIICMIALFLLDKIVPISRNIKGIENGNIAYYQANSGVEEVLFAMTGSNPGYETGAIVGTQELKGFTYSVIASGTIIPPAGKGNSDYDKDYNKIGPGIPLQLVIDKSSLNWSSIKFTFKIPDLNNDNTTETLFGDVGTGMINWILSGSGNYLIASGSENMITRGNINNTFKLGDKKGFDGQETGSGFQDFYDNLNCGTNKCNLKLSVVNSLLLDTGEFAPYLEYKITGFNSTIPLQVATINTSGFSYGFKKNITRFIQQITTFEALDFVIFQ